MNYKHLLLTVSMTIAFAIGSKATPYVYIYEAEAVITNDTTIVVEDFAVKFKQMTAEVTGVVRSENSKNIKVTIDRSSTTAYEDNYCYAGTMGNCFGTNYQPQQVIEYTIAEIDNQQITIHFYPKQIGTETIRYTISDGIGEDITFSLEFVCLSLGVEEINTDNTAIEGIYTLLGQKVIATSIDELPKGIYIVNGKKVVKQ